MQLKLKSFATAIVALCLFSVPAFAQTTIFSWSPNGSNTGNGGYSFRQEITTTGNSLGQISVALTSAVGTLQMDHVSYCIANTAPNCAAAPVELTFNGGQHGFGPIIAGATATSDYVNFSATGTDVIVIMDISAASPGDMAYANNVTNAVSTNFKAATASYNSTTVSGFTSAGGTEPNAAVTTITTQAGAGSTPCSLTLLGVGKC